MGRRTEWPESQIAAGDLAHEIALLKAQDGGYLLAHGGAVFAQALSRERLVDEYRLVIHPAALGDGLPLFKDLPSRIALELVESHAYSTGAALHVYRPR
jgi:dihydrofolate reductase